MKRNHAPAVICALLCAALLCACTGGTAPAPVPTAPAPEKGAETDAPSASAPTSMNVFVTISDAGTIVAADRPVTARDFNEDGLITLFDALYAAHEDFYDGGAAAGFEAVPGDFGLNISMLWGNENGGSYGYYINDVGAMNLEELLLPDCHVTAYSYADLDTWSDTYSFFDVKEASVSADESLALSLSIVSFDENWNTVILPLAGAGITVNDIPVNTMTDENGAVSLSFPETGTYIISAYCDDLTLVPPVCVIEVG